MSTTRRDRTQLFAAVFAALLIALFVGRASSAAFTDTTENPDNSFAAGTIVLTDDDAGAALFTMPNTTTVPGSTSTQCITVTYSGSVTDPDIVKVYAQQAVTDSDNLSDYIDVVITQGNLGATCGAFVGTQIFSGTVNTFDNTTSYAASTYGTWEPTLVTDASRAYQIQVTINASAPNSVQGDTVSNLDIMWETQSK